LCNAQLRKESSSITSKEKAMPIPTAIATAAAGYKANAGTLEKSFAGLSPEEWQTRPNETSNPMLWIAGHLVWSRSLVLKSLGAEFSRPWLPLFARGSKLADASEYPSQEEILEAWSEVKSELTRAMEDASVEALSAPAPEKMPTIDGTLGGLLGFMAWHETYHVGQAAYLRRWLGHGQVVG
jgi:uncharacterized damage-inducible protein DinB